MSNISTSKIASPQLPIGKATATKNSSIAQSSFNNAFNQVKSDNVSKDGSFVLGKNITVTDLISPQEKEMPTFSGQIKMPDGSIANVESVHAKIFTHEQDVELLQQTGMTKAEAEEMLKPIPPQPEEKEQTPQEMKAYLISQKIEAVVRDKEGNIAAKLYKDGSTANFKIAG
jgi:molecular chaperone DnaK (HSP70)